MDEGPEADPLHDPLDPDAGADGPAHPGATTPIASPAWTRTVSPTATSTRATLTSSRPDPVSTRARPSSRSVSTRTRTASSEQVMQASSGHGAAVSPRPARDGSTSPAYEHAQSGLRCGDGRRAIPDR